MIYSWMIFPRQTVGLWIRHVGCRLGPSVIPRGIVYLYFAAVFGFIQRLNIIFSCLGYYSVHLCDTQQYVWDNTSRQHRWCCLWGQRTPCEGFERPCRPPARFTSRGRKMSNLWWHHLWKLHRLDSYLPLSAILISLCPAAFFSLAYSCPSIHKFVLALLCWNYQLLTFFLWWLLLRECMN